MEKQRQHFCFSIFFFATSGSANITVKEHLSKTPGEVGDGAAARKALKDRCDVISKEARRATRAELVTAKMEDDRDPQDFFSKQELLLDRLKDTGEEVSEEAYQSGTAQRSDD